LLQIHYPKSSDEAVRWILSVIFGEFLGIEFVVRSSTEEGYSLRLNGRQLDLSDVFFKSSLARWLLEGPTIKTPLALWDPSNSGLSIRLVDQPLPVVFGEPRIQIEQNRIKCHIDIIGTAFYFLSRYEEMIGTDRDEYDRFPATSSLAYRAELIARPIVDEYVEVLWACMMHLWPALERKTRQGVVRVTCDVDTPYDCTAKTVFRLARATAGDVINRRSFKSTRMRVLNYVSTQRGQYHNDPFDTFDWYMDKCEHSGRQAAFYFIVDHSSKLMDGCYDISEPRIQDLLRRIDIRGHEIGTHGSFNSYRDARQLSQERQRLIDTCQNLGIDASVKGNRQHFLRWDTSQTPDHLDASGYEYDSTGSFADMPGFRYGTSRPFTMWSWKKCAPLQIRQRPLILMEVSVIADRYMGLGYTDDAIAVMMSMKQRVLAFGGDFTLLWHNSHLTTEADKSIFSELIA
jgi:hypothetical protein